MKVFDSKFPIKLSSFHIFHAPLVNFITNNKSPFKPDVQGFLYFSLVIFQSNYTFKVRWYIVGLYMFMCVCRCCILVSVTKIFIFWGENCRLIVRMSATATRNVGMSVGSLVVKPPAHPTYDLKGVIQLALSEDAGDRGKITILLLGLYFLNCICIWHQMECFNFYVCGVLRKLLLIIN